MYNPLDDYNISTKVLKSTREMLQKEHGRQFTDDKVMDVAVLMKKLANWSLDIFFEDERRKNMLADNKDGFLYDKKGYTCIICGHGGEDEGMWFDENGLKFMTCQRAVDSGVIPGEITDDKECYYTEFDLDYFFGVNVKALIKWIKLGLIKERTIPYKGGKGKHYRIFLMADNYGFLPQKELLRFGKITTEMVNGEQVERTLRWYQCCDPFEYLKDYKEMQYLKSKELEPSPAGKTASTFRKDDVTVPSETYFAPCTFPANKDEIKSVKKRKAKRK